MTFENLGLMKPILAAVAETGYEHPTPVQEGTIQATLGGHDVMASAQTGTGKTAAFTLPILQKLAQGQNGKAPRALIVTPTRELAAQIQDSIITYGKHLNLRSIAVFGGVKIGPQITKLRQGMDILVATPGRLLDLHNQRALNLSEIEILVLDEADRMLDMGFIHDVRKIQSKVPEHRQSLMFSATFSPEIRQLARAMLKSPVEVDVSPKNSAAETVAQLVFPVDKKRKTALLAHLYHEFGWNQSLVFTRTKHGANRLVRDLSKSGIKAEAIHGNKSQSQRTKALHGFKNGKVSMLVATDIASRGIDINELPLVVNFDLPNVSEDYVHRIGRTGRAGSQGAALSLVSADEAKQLHAIERLIKQQIEREEVEGFEPQENVPFAKINTRQSNRSDSGNGRSDSRGSGRGKGKGNGRRNGNNSSSNRSSGQGSRGRRGRGRSAAA